MVFFRQKIFKGSPLLEYVGEVTSHQEAEKRAEIPPHFSSYIMEIKSFNSLYLFLSIDVLNNNV